MRSPNGMKKRRHGIGRRTRQTFSCTKPASRTTARQRGISAAGATGLSGSQRKWKTDTPCKRLRSKAGSAQGSPAKKRATACVWCTAGATRISNGAITQATPTPSCGSRALRFACGFMRTACINNQKKKNGKTKKAPMHSALFYAAAGIGRVPQCVRFVCSARRRHGSRQNRLKMHANSSISKYGSTKSKDFSCEE